MSAVCSLRYEALGKFGEETRVALGYASSVTTVQGATFNMRGQLYCGHINATALFSSPVVSALGSKSDNPGSSPGWGKAL